MLLDRPWGAIIIMVLVCMMGDDSANALAINGSSDIVINGVTPQKSDLLSWLNRGINFGAGGSDISLNNSFLWAPTQTVDGKCTNSISCDYNRLLTIRDSVDASSAANGVRIWHFEDDVWTGAKNGRTGLWDAIFVRQTPADASPMVAAVFAVNLSASPTGTGGLAGAWSLNNNVNSTTSGWNSLAGIEQDMGCWSTCNIHELGGIFIVLLGTNTTAGDIANVAFSAGVALGGTATLDAGYTIGGYDGYMPIASTGSVLRCWTHGDDRTVPSGTHPCADASGNSTIAHGIDLSGLTFSSDAFKSTGFTVDGSGNVTSPSYQTSTALITSTNNLTASFLTNGVGGTGGPTTAAQNGWLKMKDSSGATIWIPVWK